MAWIESHQDLRTNPKAKRLARLLDVPLAQAIGHLHMLWWWALDHAFEGDLSKFDAFDIADAAGWDGDEDTFVEALVTCGPKDRSGFIDRAASGHLWLHDWHEFTAYLRQRRESAQTANHVRHHEKKGVRAPDCPLCYPDGLRTDSGRTPPGTPNPVPTDSASPPSGTPPEPEPGPTGTGTYRDQPEPTPRAHPRDATNDPAANGHTTRGEDPDPIDPYWTRVVADLPGPLVRRLGDEPEPHRRRLRTALARAAERDISPGALKALWDRPNALDSRRIKSVAATLAHRIETYLGDDQEASA